MTKMLQFHWEYMPFSHVAHYSEKVRKMRILEKFMKKVKTVEMCGILWKVRKVRNLRKSAKMRKVRKYIKFHPNFIGFHKGFCIWSIFCRFSENYVNLEYFYEILVKSYIFCENNIFCKIYVKTIISRFFMSKTSMSKIPYKIQWNIDEI